MTDLADLFPGFASEFVDNGFGRIFVRTGGKGPPLLALHGYPQTHAMWHRIAPDLAERFSMVIADLSGLRHRPMRPPAVACTSLTPNAQWQ